MHHLVLKFGGTSMQTPAIIKQVADIIKDKLKQQNDIKITIIVSAMYNHTNQLCEYVDSMQPHHLDNTLQKINADFIISSGEHITAGLLALALQQYNIDAIALSAWQIPIQTDNQWNNASITNINVECIKDLLSKNIIPIITGFQGIAFMKELNLHCTSTLGRGGSDTSAIAIACALNATKCEIFTDVPGIFTADPNIVPHAKLIPYIDYQFLEILTECGAKVVHAQAAKIANENKIALRICSTFAPEQLGTILVENAPRTVCLVWKPLIQLEYTIPQHDLIPTTAIFHTYNHHTHLYTGVFTPTEYNALKYNQPITQLHIKNVYQITIVKPHKTNCNLNITGLLLSHGVHVFNISTFDLGFVLIVNDHKTALNVLHQMYYMKHIDL